jgi:hypothetical protein
MKISQIIQETTTSGSVAPVELGFVKMQTRNPSVYGDTKAGNLLKGKKTNKPFANSVNESKMKDLAYDMETMKPAEFQKKYGKSREQMKASPINKPAQPQKPTPLVNEADLQEDDVILVPGQGRKTKTGFVPHGESRVDHEVEMAVSDLFSAGKNAEKIYNIVRSISEEEGLEGWVQEKIIKANDYLNTVREYLEGKQVQGMAEGLNDTVYPNAEVIKSKNGKPVGEIYQDGNSWGAFHYRADRGYDMIDSREDAIEALKDLHQETGRSRPDYTIKGVAEGLPQTLRKVVPGHAKREIDKKMDAGKFGKTDADKDANFQRYKKIQDKLKEQGVEEGFGLRGTGNPGMPTPYDQGRADAKKGRPYDNPYDQPGEEQEHRNYRKGYEQGKEQGVAEGAEQVYKVLAVDKSNALSKQVKLKVKASSLDEVFERLAINDWYPLEINGVEVINGKRLKQGVAEGAKVDRMVKHIEKSEKKLGKSEKEAENIAWATANKRGMLDNKNKKA